MSTREQLQATLKELEAELETLDTLDEPTRQMLEQAMGEIQLALRKQVQQAPVGQPSKQSQHSQDLAGGLREAVEAFGSSHPTLTGILNRIADALAQLGI